MSLEFLEHICSMVEVLVKKKYNINKSEIVINFFELIFEINEQEKEIINKNIEYLINNKIVKQIPFVKVMGKYFYSYLKKKMV
jgi:hypothetical protein